MTRGNRSRGRLTPGQSSAQRIRELEARLAQIEREKRTSEERLDSACTYISQLEGQLRETAYRADHDPVTRLLRKEVVETEIMRLLKSLDESAKSRLAVLFLDIDDFKVFNDTFGHNVGDDVLRRVSAAIKRVIRPGDIAGRGDKGDEFIILLRDTRAEEAGRILEAICRSVGSEQHEAHELRTAVLHSYSTGVSGGVAMYPGDKVTLQTWKFLADKAMYENKRRRRKGGDK